MLNVSGQVRKHMEFEVICLYLWKGISISVCLVFICHTWTWSYMQNWKPKWITNIFHVLFFNCIGAYVHRVCLCVHLCLYMFSVIDPHCTLEILIFLQKLLNACYVPSNVSGLLCMHISLSLHIQPVRQVQCSLILQMRKIGLREREGISQGYSASKRQEKD